MDKYKNKRILKRQFAKQNRKTTKFNLLSNQLYMNYNNLTFSRVKSFYKRRFVTDDFINVQYNKIKKMLESFFGIEAIIITEDIDVIYNYLKENKYITDKCNIVFEKGNEDKKYLYDFSYIKSVSVSELREMILKTQYAFLKVNQYFYGISGYVLFVNNGTCFSDLNKAFRTRNLISLVGVKNSLRFLTKYGFKKIWKNNRDIIKYLHKIDLNFIENCEIDISDNYFPYLKLKFDQKEDLNSLGDFLRVYNINFDIFEDSIIFSFDFYIVQEEINDLIKILKKYYYEQ